MWDGKERLNPGREPFCTRVSMEVMPCVMRVSAMSSCGLGGLDGAKGEGEGRRSGWMDGVDGGG